MVKHRAQGKRAVFVHSGRMVLATGQDEVVLAEMATIPLACAGQDASQVGNVMAAVGAAWALGISHDLIRAGIQIFGLDLAGVAGKEIFNTAA
jgi:cyanophycin synthetase